MTDITPQNSNVLAIPKWFIAVAVLAFIWNLMGVIAFVVQMMMTPEHMANLAEEEQQLYAAIPVWATIAFAVAVFAGALGSLALIMKKNIAKILFIISLVGVLVQMFHSFFIIDSFAVYGPGGLVMPIMVIVSAILLVKFATFAQKQQWLN